MAAELSRSEPGRSDPGRSELNKDEIIGRRVALVSVTVGVLLSTAKILVGKSVGSAAVTSDGIETAGDVLSSAVVYAGLWLASKPPDYEHPYGHGRYETLAGLAIGGMLLLTGTAIFWHGFISLGLRHELEAYALYPLIAAIVLKIAFAAVKLRLARKIDSASLEADAWHDVTDLLSTSIALVAVIMTLLNSVRFGAADHVGGMLIGVIIFSLSIRVVRRTVGQLLDTMPEPRKMGQIRQAALSVPGSLGIEKCFARRTGLKYHVDLHLEVDPHMTVLQSHEIAKHVKIAIKDSLPWVADVLVHVEPSPVIPALPASRLESR